MAEFVKVMRDARRMCNNFEGCEGCALNFSDDSCALSIVTNDNSCNDEKTKKAEEAIEQWAELHPEKTNLDALKKAFPKVNFSFDDFCLIKTFGVVKSCAECTEKYRRASCSEVVKEFLNSPYEELEEEGMKNHSNGYQPHGGKLNPVPPSGGSNIGGYQTSKDSGLPPPPIGAKSTATEKEVIGNEYTKLVRNLFYQTRDRMKHINSIATHFLKNPPKGESLETQKYMFEIMRLSKSKDCESSGKEFAIPAKMVDEILSDLDVQEKEDEN